MNLALLVGSLVVLLATNATAAGKEQPPSISGYDVRESRILVGAIMQSRPNIKNAKACAKACTAKAGCNSFTYIPDKKICEFKAEKAFQAGDYAGYISGISTRQDVVTAPLPGPATTSAAPSSDNQEFNPFAQSTAPPPASSAPPTGQAGQGASGMLKIAPQAKAPSAAPSADNQEFNPFAQSTPPPAANSMLRIEPADQGASGLPKIAPQATAPPAPSSATTANPGPNSLEKFVGVWVEEVEVQSLTTGNPEDDSSDDAPSGRYRVPRRIVVSNPGGSPTLLIFEDDASPTNVVPLPMTKPNEFSNGTLTATFQLRGETWFMKLSNPLMPIGPMVNGVPSMVPLVPFFSGQFGLATLPAPENRTLSRDRFSTAGFNLREDRCTTTAGGIGKAFPYNYHGYLGREMNIFQPGAGQKLPIFKQDTCKAWSMNDQYGGALPYGVTGQRLDISTAHTMDIMISSESETERAFSLNFGGSGTAEGVSLGGDFSYSESHKASQSTTTSKVFGIGRVSKYALILDRPNMLLDDSFRYAIDQVAEGTMTAMDLILKYGSHYANAITYGGLAKAEKVMTLDEFTSRVSTKWGLSLTAGGGGGEGGKGKKNKKGKKPGKSQQGGGGGKGAMTEATVKAQGGKSMWTQHDWTAIGGVGSFNEFTWQVTNDDVVPVRYDLRPIAELISPVFIPELRGGSRDKYVRARLEVAKAVEVYMASGPKPSDQDFSPRVYRITFDRIYCEQTGSDNNLIASSSRLAPPPNLKDGDLVKIRGKITAQFTDDTGPFKMDLFDSTLNEPGSLAAPVEGKGEYLGCGDSNFAWPIGKKSKVLMASSGSPSMAYLIGPEDLWDVDAGPRATLDVFYEDDPILPLDGSWRQPEALMLKPGQKQTGLLWSFGFGLAPRISVRYDIQRLN